MRYFLNDQSNIQRDWVNLAWTWILGYFWAWFVPNICVKAWFRVPLGEPHATILYFANRIIPNLEITSHVTFSLYFTIGWFYRARRNLIIKFNQADDNIMRLKYNYYNLYTPIVHIFITCLTPIEHMLLFLDQEFWICLLSIQFHWIQNYLSAPWYLSLLY